LAAQAAQYDLNRDGTVTPEEIQTGRAAEFNRADSNRDGQLSLAELHSVQTERRAARFAQRDANGDGVLSLDEFQAQRRMPPAQAATVFGLADRDHDGSLSQDESAQLRGPQGRVWRQFARLDGNGDGVVSAAEYTAAVPGQGRGGRCQP
jgi:Ca2+-binding EF-hand superfamily protein